jgi:single-strand DNA-binding protein
MRVNNCTIGGNLCADPESREVGDSHLLSTFRIANNHGQDRVSFINIECWDKTAENVQQYLEKGSGVVVQGQLMTDTYEDRDGNKRAKAWIKAFSVEFLPRKAPNSEEHTSSDADEPVTNRVEDETPF